MLKEFAKQVLQVSPKIPLFILDRLIKESQPPEKRAKVVFSVLTKAGPLANGKVSAFEFLPTFCDTLRRNGFATEWASNVAELDASLNDEVPVFLVHLFGEDHSDIFSAEVLDLEKKAVATFNTAEAGQLLADKLASHKAFVDAGIPVPTLRETGGFVRSRFGTALPTEIQEGTEALPAEDERRIFTDFVDTRIEYDGRLFYTTVRIVCIDGTILHSYPRARDAKEENPSVHAKDTPLEPALVEYLNDVLVVPNAEAFEGIARNLHHVLGHGFFAHDLVIDNVSGEIFVCEGGFKFDDPSYWRHMKRISSDLPSQAVLFPIQNFAKHSSETFCRRCLSILEKTPVKAASAAGLGSN